MSQPGSAIARIEDFDPDKYLVLQPVTLVRQGELVSPVLYDTVTVIQPNPDPEGPDVYKAWWKGGRLAPRAALLHRIGQAAGLRWATPNFHGGPKTDPATGHRSILVTAGAAVRQPNGEWVAIPKTKEIDTAVLEEKWLAEAVAKTKLEAPNEQIRADVARRIMHMKSKIVEEAETKAMSRVLRSLLGVAQDYSPREIARPIAVPRVIYRPEYAQALEEGSRAVAELGWGETVGGSPPPVAAPAEAPVSAQAPGPHKEQSAAATASKDQAEASAGTDGPPEPDGSPEPKGDPFFEDGPHKGERFSEVVQTDPKYLEFLMTDKRQTKTVQDLARQWLEYERPTQPSLEV